MCCDYFISLNGIYNNPTLFILQHFLLRIETFRQKLGTIRMKEGIFMTEKMNKIIEQLKSMGYDDAKGLFKNKC